MRYNILNTSFYEGDLIEKLLKRHQRWFIQIDFIFKS